MSSLLVWHRGKYDKIIASQSTFKLISIVDRCRGDQIDTRINQPSLSGGRTWLFLRPAYPQDNDSSLQDSSEGFSDEQGTDRLRFRDPYCVFVTTPTTRTLLPISNHQSETDVRPSTGISDTPRCPVNVHVSRINLPRPETEFLSHDRHRGLYFSSAATRRVLMLSVWTKRDAREMSRDRDNNGPISRTGENWPASPRVATLIDIRRTHAPHRPWRRATLRR